MANLEQNQEQKLENIIDDESSYDDDSNSEELMQQNKKEVNRYYNHSSSEVCFKCEKTGHTENNCSEQICVICLKPHQRQECTNIFKCFTCGDKSHSQQDCPNKDQNRCYKCHKVGHSGKQCGYLVLSQEYVFNKIKCIKCPSEGHNNCHIKNWHTEKLVLNDKLFNFNNSLQQQKALERIRNLEQNFYQAQTSSFIGYHIRRYQPDPLPYYQKLVSQNSESLHSEFEDYNHFDDFITEEPEGEEEFTDFKKVLKNQIQGQSKRLAQNTIKKKEAMQKNFQKQIFKNPISKINMVQQQYNENGSSSYMNQNQSQYKKSSKYTDKFNNPNSSSYYYYNNNSSPDKNMFQMNQNNNQRNFNKNYYQNDMMMNQQQMNQQMFQMPQNFQNQSFKQNKQNGRMKYPKHKQKKYQNYQQQQRGNMMGPVSLDYQQNQQQFNFPNNYNQKNMYQNNQQSPNYNYEFQSYSNKNYQKNQQKYKKNYKKNKNRSQLFQFLFIKMFLFFFIFFIEIIFTSIYNVCSKPSLQFIQQRVEQLKEQNGEYIDKQITKYILETSKQQNQKIEFVIDVNMNYDRAYSIIQNQNKLVKIIDHNDLFILFNNCLIPNLTSLNKNMENLSLSQQKILEEQEFSKIQNMYLLLKYEAYWLYNQNFNIQQLLQKSDLLNKLNFIQQITYKIGKIHELDLAVCNISPSSFQANFNLTQIKISELIMMVNDQNNSCPFQNYYSPPENIDGFLILQNQYNREQIQNQDVEENISIFLKNLEIQFKSFCDVYQKNSFYIKIIDQNFLMNQYKQLFQSIDNVIDSSEEQQDDQFLTNIFKTSEEEIKDENNNIEKELKMKNFQYKIDFDQFDNQISLYLEKMNNSDEQTSNQRLINQRPLNVPNFILYLYRKNKQYIENQNLNIKIKNLDSDQYDIKRLQRIDSFSLCLSIVEFFDHLKIMSIFQEYYALDMERYLALMKTIFELNLINNYKKSINFIVTSFIGTKLLNILYNGLQLQNEKRSSVIEISNQVSLVLRFYKKMINFLQNEKNIFDKDFTIQKVISIYQNLSTSLSIDIKENFVKFDENYFLSLFQWRKQIINNY